ncbi:unnamed protein product, partial [Iphiclides podalirius]
MCCTCESRSPPAAIRSESAAHNRRTRSGETKREKAFPITVRVFINSVTVLDTNKGVGHGQKTDWQRSVVVSARGNGAHWARVEGGPARVAPAPPAPPRAPLTAQAQPTEPDTDTSLHN